MAKQPSDKKSIQITVRTIYEKGSPIFFANFTRFSHLGTDVILDIGLLDDQILLSKLANDQSSLPLEGRLEVPAYIHQRFGMNVSTFLQLRKNVEEMWGKIKESGALKNLDIEE